MLKSEKGVNSMSANYNQEALRSMLRERLQQHSWSMRKFSERTNIDTATISRIINGKRQANLTHLERFADVLHIPLVELLALIGYDVYKGTPSDKNEPNMQQSIQSIEQFLQTSPIFNVDFSVAKVNEQLHSYNDLSQTSDGENIILNKFEEKMNRNGSDGPFIQQLMNWYQIFRSQKRSKAELAIMGGALLYFIMPFDVIPDHLFPIGYLDDIVAVKLAMYSLTSINTNVEDR